MKMTLATAILLLCLAFGATAASAQSAYVPIYAHFSERSYAPENMGLAKQSSEAMTAGRYAKALPYIDKLLARPDLNPYEISNTAYFKGVAHEELIRSGRDMAHAHAVAAQEAYRAAIAARGLMTGEYENVSRSLARVERKLALLTAQMD